MNARDDESLGLPTAPGTFLADPSLNLGDNPNDPTSLNVLFHSRESARREAIRCGKSQPQQPNPSTPPPLKTCRPARSSATKTFAITNPSFTPPPQARQAPGQSFHCGTFPDAYAWFDSRKQPKNGPGNIFSFTSATPAEPCSAATVTPISAHPQFAIGSTPT